VSWSGRIIQPRKKAAIAEKSPPILQRLNLNQAQFANYLRKKPDKLPNALGPVTAMRQLARSFGLKFLHGTAQREILLNPR
jgi:hypothetical protein